MSKKQIRKLLVANRGEIAVRILRTARELGIHTVAVYSDDDTKALHVQEADESYLIGPAPSTESYLVIDKLLEVAKKSGCDAVHPGYGFLSEKESFAQAVEKAGITFVGPSSAQIAQMGDKVEARSKMESLGLPIAPGTGALNEVDEAVAAVEKLLNERPDFRYPLLVKASGGGGGKGMRRIDQPAQLRDALERAQSESLKAFNNPTLFVERFIELPRHIEVQVFGDGKNAVHLYERECSLQRRHQKVVEEALSPSIAEKTRKKMLEAAAKATEKLGYRGAGTIEFIVSQDDEFYFLEMNTRIQVEHPVTELILSVDLIREQLRTAGGAALSFEQDELRPQGHAIEARLYAEDADHQFLPQPGRLHYLRFPQWAGIRVDTSIEEGGKISSHYDPMIAKICSWAPDRAQALARLKLYLEKLALEGLVTNRAFLLEILDSDFFTKGSYHTQILEGENWRKTVEPEPKVLAALCLKDYLGRAISTRAEKLSQWQVSQ